MWIRKLSSSVLLFVLVLCLFSCSGTKKASPVMALRDFLPRESDLRGWTREGDLQEFKGEDLYLYINGGAEIYLEYGFRKTVVQDYKDTMGHSVSLEIFEMTEPASAYGMFTFKISGEGQDIDLGDGGELDSYYLNFWKGPYLVTLTGFDMEPETVEGLRSIGRAVEAGIPVSSEKPPLASLLSDLGFERTRYLRGFLGLNSVYSFYTARGLNFEEGVRGIGEDGSVTLILKYGAEDGGQKAFEDLRDYLAVSERFTGTDTADNKFLSTMDERDRPVALAPSGAYLFVGIGAEREIAREVFDLVREKLGEKPTTSPY